ncbi:MAG: DMT family transporter [Candidatus Neomarinimicrobiota bacterium]
MLLALLVTLLWSTSFIIIKLGLTELPPLTFAGLRYFLAFLCLLPVTLRRKDTRAEFRYLSRRQWLRLVALGLVFYTFTQGAQFLGLALLPAVTVSLMLNFTPLVVAVAGIRLLQELPTPRQWLGVFLFIAGILVYFYPADFGASRWTGLVVMGFGVLANSGAALLGRDINRRGDLSPLLVTTVSMGIGAVILLVAGIIIQGLPPLGWRMIAALVWLAAVNTALAFTLWNITLRTLSAMESSIINGTMLIQIAVLAWIFLGEAITSQEIAGILLAALGVVLVQLKNIHR